MIETRQIKSFVKRKGRISKAQYNGLNLAYKYSISLSEVDNLDQNNNSPIVLEIGFGMADNLIFNSLKYPDYLFIGADVFLPGIGNAVNQIEKNNILNCFIFNGDANDLLNTKIKFDRIQILFPDPWPKKKHHKRRLINEEFLANIYNNLNVNAVVYVVTDWQDYACEIADVFSTNLNYSNIITNNKMQLERCTTKFEIKAQQKEHKIFEFLYQKH